MIITSLVVPLDVSGVVRLCRCRCFVAAAIIFLAFEPLGYLFQPRRVKRVEGAAVGVICD